MPSRRSWPTLDKDDSWRMRSLEERARAIESACRTAMQILEESPQKTRMLGHIDPVPSSTLSHLRRLARR
jgi:hypothetical protein